MTRRIRACCGLPAMCGGVKVNSTRQPAIVPVHPIGCRTARAARTARP
jgi:hypothetical protein